MKSRYKNENANEPDHMRIPRIVYPNDILPDENPLSEMSREAQFAEVKTDGSNPRG
jgi:hypothetical protein